MLLVTPWNTLFRSLTTFTQFLKKIARKSKTNSETQKNQIFVFNSIWNVNKVVNTYLQNAAITKIWQIWLGTQRMKNAIAKPVRSYWLGTVCSNQWSSTFSKYPGLFSSKNSLKVVFILPHFHQLRLRMRPKKEPPRHREGWFFIPLSTE